MRCWRSKDFFFIEFNSSDGINANVPNIKVIDSNYMICLVVNILMISFKCDQFDFYILNFYHEYLKIFERIYIYIF